MCGEWRGVWGELRRGVREGTRREGVGVRGGRREGVVELGRGGRRGGVRGGSDGGEAVEGEGEEEEEEGEGEGEDEEREEERDLELPDDDLELDEDSAEHAQLEHDAHRFASASASPLGGAGSNPGLSRIASSACVGKSTSCAGVGAGWRSTKCACIAMSAACVMFHPRASWSLMAERSGAERSEAKRSGALEGGGAARRGRAVERGALRVVGCGGAMRRARWGVEGWGQGGAAQLRWAAERRGAAGVSRAMRGCRRWRCSS